MIQYRSFDLCYIRRVLILTLVFAWGVPVDVYVAAGLGGVNHSSLSQLDAARVF